MKDLVQVGRPLDFEVDSEGFWRVTPHGWITRHEWEQIQDFQAELPPLPPYFPHQFIDSLLRNTKRWNEIPWAAEVDRRIRMNPSKTCLWTVLYSARSGDEGGVDMVTLGRETLVLVDLGARIFRPLLRGICAVVNFFKMKIR